MKHKRHIPVGKILLYLAAAFQSTQYARAFHAIDARSQWSDIGGLLAGIVVNVSLAYSASRLPKLRAKSAKRYSQAAFAALLILTPLFLAPINYTTMGNLWLSVPILRGLLAFLAASLVDVAIVLVAFADGSLLSESATESERSASGVRRSATDSAKSASGVRRSAKKSAKSATDSDGVQRTYPRKCDYCDAQIKSPNAVGGHMKKHHPELCKPKPLAVELFEGKKAQS